MDQPKYVIVDMIFTVIQELVHCTRTLSPTRKRESRSNFAIDLIDDEQEMALLVDIFYEGIRFVLTLEPSFFVNETKITSSSKIVFQLSNSTINSKTSSMTKKRTTNINVTKSLYRKREENESSHGGGECNVLA